MRLYLPSAIRDPLLGAISRLEISFDVQVSLKRVRRYGWKWSRDWEYAVDLAVRFGYSLSSLYGLKREGGGSWRGEERGFASCGAGEWSSFRTRRKRSLGGDDMRSCETVEVAQRLAATTTSPSQSETRHSADSSCPSCS